MKADIEWVEKPGGGIKRKIRITFEGSSIKWQFKASDQERWDYTTPPTAADWETLQEKVEALYNRRRTSYRNVELVRQMKRRATGG